MAWWIYKCNSRHGEHQRDSGDWEWFFERGVPGRWGTTQILPSLAKLNEGDMIIAYQTDRNELVGICRFLRFKPDGRHKIVHLQPLKRIGVKVRPLKLTDRKIAAIPALQGGPIMTLYSISDEDAKRLLDAAGAPADYSRTPRGRRFISILPADASAMEGLRTETVTYTRGRSRALRDLALARSRGVCEVCSINFSKLLDGKGVRALQAHHKKQLAVSDRPRVTKLSDLAVLCANCHSLIHVDPRKAMSVERLRRLLQH